MRYLIWSWEHLAWWRPNGQGYTRDVEEAGRYTEGEAAQETVGHVPPGEEVAVDEWWATNRGRPPVYGVKPATPEMRAGPGLDLASHIFEMGVAMNRVAAEAAQGAREAAVRDDTDDAEWDPSDPFSCPPNARESLLRYWHERIPTGGFLLAVLENNLREAFSRADDVNVRHLGGIVRWCYWELPSPAWGSPERVRAWLAREDEAPKETP